MEDKVRAHAIISGRVQGVFYRMETKRAADDRMVYGWVRNRRDKTVEAVFEGEREQVNAVLDWCRMGPPHANVTDVKVTWQEYKGDFRGFEVSFERGD